MIAMRILIILFPLLAVTSLAFGATGTLTVAAIVPLNNGSCTVQGTQPVNFGTLDPLSPQAVVTATGSVTAKCKGLGKAGATVAVALSSPTPLTLKHTGTPAFSIPYIVELPTAAFVPPNGSGTVTIPITAELYGSDYRLAPAGAYADTITVQVTP